MFRKPRETSGNAQTAAVLGRPPTPPNAPTKSPLYSTQPSTTLVTTMATTKTKSSKSAPLPTIGRQGPVGSAKKAAAAAKSRQSPKANGSILSFFKKSDDDEVNRLFVEERFQSGSAISKSLEECSSDESPNEPSYGRFNEEEGSSKRRKLSTGEEANENATHELSTPSRDQNHISRSSRKAGPFVEDSDSDQEDEVPEAIMSVGQDKSDSLTAVEMPPQAAFANEVPDQSKAETDVTPLASTNDPSSHPVLIKEETSLEPEMVDFKDFEDMGDFDEDIYEEGDEYMERRYMEEQALLEAEEDGMTHDEELAQDHVQVKSEPPDEAAADGDVPSCPICNASLARVSEQDAGIHVNNCLDGNPTPLPPAKEPEPPTPVKTEGTISANQFRRPVRAPKPGQANPFALGESTTIGGSAFNKLMSGHVEDAAWAEAAASEHAARGKPSYQRTCPFYKILPGLFICVDAFRYGAIEGCQAYFLSHFHSDHYVGLTSYWCHGPIFCSKVTANLVIQQLKVDPKYVVPLEWEKTVDVPGTRGVRVTMISANHCPGSSLYLFEKTVGKKQNGEPRLQRILHCGDFRVCKMHIQHPLLLPSVQDSVSGKTKDQKIDVCYLDTTYLNPKYAFPSQEVVIKACADMCVCLSKDTPDETDGWEQMKRMRAGEGMVKFVRKESNPDTNPEPADDGDPDAMKIERPPRGGHGDQPILSSINEQKGRGRLLVVVGTYSIGKERICLGIAKALGSKIYAPPSKQRIVAALEDAELDARMTTDPRAAQVHMTALFEIRAETLDDYLRDYFPHFTRAVGFRPTGWNYRPPAGRFTDSPPVASVLHSDNWKSGYSMRDLVPQRGSSARASCFGVPYSEHSSFRELTVFCCALRIDKIIPTVNVGSAKSRERMKAWCERWAVERKKNGLYKLPEDGSW